MFHVKLFIMSYRFNFSFVRTVEHDDFGGYDTTEEFFSDSFAFADVDDFLRQFADSVLTAAVSELRGRGLRVYNFFELFGVLECSFKTFLEQPVKSGHHIQDQTLYSVPTWPVKRVDLYYSFEVSSVD